MSDLDKRIIEHLQADGRRPFTQIAAQLGERRRRTSPDQPPHRTRHPPDSRRDRPAEARVSADGDDRHPLRVRPARVGRGAGRRDARGRLRGAITAGAYDLLIETVCEDNEALLRFLTERLRAIEGVRETETFVYLRMVKQTYQWGTR